MNPEPELPVDDDPPAELDALAATHGEDQEADDEDG